jgi:protein Tex
LRRIKITSIDYSLHMKKLQEIARRVRRPEEQLRFPVELIQQGYEPNYLANYRPDELGGLDELTLSTLKRAMKCVESIEEYRAKILASLENDPNVNSTVKEVIQQASSIAQIDTSIRHIRSRKNAKSVADACPAAAVVGHAVLTMQEEAPSDLLAWVTQVANVPSEQAEDVLNQARQWLTYLLGEDLRFMSDLQEYVLDRGSVTFKVLQEPAKGSELEKQVDAIEDAVSSGNTEATASLMPVAQPSTENHQEPQTPLNASEDSSPTLEGEATSHAIVPEPTAEALTSPEETVAPLIAEFNQGKKSSKPIRTKSLSDKQLSPRQRRRRWIRNILESYSKMKKPVGDLSPFQILMISRGLRSQIIQLQFHYDKKPLVNKCREAFYSGRHPMHSFLAQVAEHALDTHLLPRVHQDVMSILEEFAYEELTEAAVVHLHGLMLQRPIRGHRILIIDAIGPKMAPVAIVDAEGEVVFTGEIPCNSNRPDIVAQNVVTLGQWVHKHRVTLVSMSNGPARRYLSPSIAELLKQSAEGSLYWAMVDRAGADAYCNSRICLVELPNITRRHRASVWLARRLQDPLRQMLKVEPTRLRLGSYQREIPQNDLEVALRDAVSSAISKSGLDVFGTEPEVLQRVPGMTLPAARAVAQACQEDRITNRETLMTVLKENLNEMQARQAIGFLRVFASDNPLDTTTIHPEDYRLAERLIEHASLPAPPASPEGWKKPDFKSLAVATAAAEATIQKQQAEFGVIPDADATDSASHEVENEEAIDANDSEQVDAPNQHDVTESSEAVASELPTDALPSSDENQTEGAESNDVGNTDVSPESATPAHDTIPMPPIDREPHTRQQLSIDVERLARSWQVGREKLKRVANCLQFPFADERDYRYPVPLVGTMPRLDTVARGDMLQALVVSVMNFGVFVDLGPDCSGLVHISRLAHQYSEDPFQHVQSGDLINVWVLDVDQKRSRVVLSAFAPGSQPAREQRDNRGDEQQRGQRPNNQRDQDQRGQSGGRGGNTQARGEGGRPERAGATQNRAGGGDRGGSSNREDRNRSAGGPGNRQRNDRPRNDRRNDRGRNDRDRNQEQGDQRRQAKVHPPKPVVPITEAMQQGKEPMRSFSDLLQFMKKDKPDTEIVVQTPPSADNSGNTSHTSDEQKPVLQDRSNSSESSTNNDSVSHANDSTNGPVA